MFIGLQQDLIVILITIEQYNFTVILSNSFNLYNFLKIGVIQESEYLITNVLINIRNATYISTERYNLIFNNLTQLGHTRNISFCAKLETASHLLLFLLKDSEQHRYNSFEELERLKYT